MRVFRILSIAAALFVAALPATAQDKRTEVLRLGNLIKYVVLAERGDVWVTSLIVENGNCGRSKNDGEDRARRLSRYYDELVQAVAAPADTQIIVDRAKRLHDTVNASKMYQRCWSTMTSRAGLVANTADIALQMFQAGS